MLEKIKTPRDIQKLSCTDLMLLARDVRQRIIDVTSINGGHLAPSLGATDLAIALLKVFNPLADRIVWDVGHQAYAYKILTERNKKFSTLRQLGGIGGFNNPEESKYDAFRVGHTSTSISAALGLQIAKELNGDKKHCIAIIGDGALTGGMSFEALNHAGHLQKNLIVILNDNEMSISPNVGALQKYLTNVLVSKSYNSLKKQVWDLSQNLPVRIKNKFIYGAQKLEESLINIMVPNIIFEDLGFKYTGPVDGHDIQLLCRTLNKIKTNMIGPVLLHVVTSKGKGLEFAENDATRFHGTGPYCLETGESPAAGKESYSSIFGKTLCELAAQNDKIVAITAAMTDGTGLCNFAQKFPNRFFDVGIAEQHAVTFAGGLAISGFKPFVAIYSTFMQRAFDQLIHDIALQRLPVVFCLDRAGLVGADGPTHHGSFDLSYLSLIPNLTIMAPAYQEEFIEMLNYAATYMDGPIAIRYPRGAAPRQHLNAPLEYAKFEVVKSGKKIAILGIGSAFQISSELHTLIEKNTDAQAYLINARFAKPLDIETLSRLKKDCEIVISIEENAVLGGFGSSIQGFFARTNVRVYSFGIPDEFVTHGTQKELMKIIMLNATDIYEQIKDAL